MTERIRVLHCLSSVANGGVERRRLMLAQRLDPKRYEQRIIARAIHGEVVEALEAAGVPVEVVGQGGLFAPRALYRATQLARAFRPHIVHGAVFEGLSVAVVAGRLCGARVVIEETSHATNRSARGHALFKGLVAASDACVAISPAVRDYLLEVTGVPDAKITLIPNGALAPSLPSPELATQTRAALGIDPSAFVVGTVARLNDESHKRVSDLVRAVGQLAGSCPELRLVVVGGGANQSVLAELARSLGVADRVILTGNREDTGSLYGIMQVFALVSAREGFGLVVAEAMLCGLPVIGTAVGGIKDLVRDGETGFLVPALDPNSIAQAILRLRADAELRRRLGDAGRLRAEQKFSAQRYSEDVDAFYARLLQQPSLWARRRT